MLNDHRKLLAGIRRFDQLVAYLRDELDWPINSDDFEELTFEYTPEELGIDTKNAAMIQNIKRLRPLVPGQPWGIFFIKFEPKRLPVVALRRILGQVALKKRASANKSERQAWATDDLLFVSNYGEGQERRIAFAHFSKPDGGRDLPTLNVLGWDNLDTPLHLDAVAQKLNDHLAWPGDEDDLDAWRESWRSAFTLRHREVITTSKRLSERLAELARATRDRIQATLDIESKTGPLTQLKKAFQTALVNDLGEAEFADMYAQTIAYGLLSARITDPTSSKADDLAAHMRTNPFLKELMETFLNLGGCRDNGGRTGIDFDELGVSEVVDLLYKSNMEAVLRDFGDRNPQEDPVIHFYEHFLAAYDKKQKVSRGVFYTPRPVVSYIVRSVHDLLRTNFGLADGLADTTTWEEMARRKPNLIVPEGVPSGQPFIQILDPATGTGTFLVEVIDLVHKTMVEKWTAQGHGEKKIRALWNAYVSEYLLPRLYGYELLMAPYAIAHLKIGLKLYETGYRFESNERAHVYLTNALEPAGSKQITLDFLPALAHEAEAVNQIKRKRQFTVVIGNPPYLGEAGRGGEWIASLMRGKELPSGRRTASYFKMDGKPLGERQIKWLNDLYVRFTRLSQHLIERSGAGVHGFITNHRYIDNPTFRGMRWSLLSAFDSLAVLDLHGNTKKREIAPSGGKDENVFEIEQGVAIGLFLKDAPKGGSEAERVAAAEVFHHDLWGTRAEKFLRLMEKCEGSAKWANVEPRPSFYVLKLLKGDVDAEYEKWTAVNQIFPVNSVGIVTARDALTIRWSKREIWRIVREMADGEEEDLRARYGIKDSQIWKIEWAQADLRQSGPSIDKVAPILYRPFDTRYTYYTGESGGFICRPLPKVMEHMLEENVGLSTTRTVEIGTGFSHVFATRAMTQHHTVSLKEVNNLFPLYLYPGVGKSGVLSLNPWPGERCGRRPNLDPGLVKRLAQSVTLRFVSEGVGNLRDTFGPEDVVAYIYAVLHSPDYRARYEAHLKLDFPRVPLPGSPALFNQMVIRGHDLVAYHLLDSPKIDILITDYAGPKNPTVGRVGWSNGTVWLDAAKTDAQQHHRATRSGQYGFHGVPEEVWDFQIGGYQVCHKWLKDRNGRTLSDEDIAHYQKIIVSISETIRTMTEIDEVIESQGGWPDAFRTGSEAIEVSEMPAKVVPFRPRKVDPKPEDCYVTCLPLVSLKAAAGGFSDPQFIEDGEFEWVAVDSRHRLRKGMFVAQVLGKSMEPAIPDSAWCLFRAPVEGTRLGKTVLVQLRDTTDPETGQSYTVKRYKSSKVGYGELWRHEHITLEPVNPDFEPIVLSSADEGDLQVIAELVEVLEN
ncbi:MAG: hypothetical protein F4193_06910 [Candidatus Dadabacteria bacterium]|nr:hypothetical protein [Gammaproteobacteria bacterium]MYG83530.1 hypothetical protein [Candidatus Dadabacteria bacterium]